MGKVGREDMAERWEWGESLKEAEKAMPREKRSWTDSVGRKNRKEV